MKAWIVILNGQEVDIVYYVPTLPAQAVRQDLVNHDGYDPRIKLVAV